MYVIRRRLSATEGAPPNTRVNPETGEVETSPDGGETWLPDERADPRLNPAYQLPPVTGDNAKCAAAAGMVENVRKVITAIGTGLSVSALATGLIALLLIPGIGWLFLAFVLFSASFIGGVGLATMNAYTEDVYDFLLCAFYRELDEDGRISEAGLHNVHAALQDEYSDPLIPDGFAAVGHLHKFVGFNNAGVVYADPDAECGECDVWCYRWESVADMVADGFGSSTMPGLSIYVTTSTGMQLTGIRYSWTSNGLGTGSGSGVAAWANAGATVLIERFLPLAGAPNPFEWEGYYSTSGLALTANAVGGSGGTVNFGWVELRGIGIRPPFTHGTECLE